MKLIVGLGNPGKKYENTRHNVGFLVMDKIQNLIRQLADKSQNFKLEKKFNAEIAKIQVGDKDAILAKPQTFMNLSGEAVQKLMQFYKIKPADIWVISDDLNLQLGQIRVRFGGSDGGHNGLKSIIEAIGEKFWRIRVGIGSNLKFKSEKLKINNIIPAEKYVLENFNKEEKEIIDKVIDETADIVVRSISSDLKEETITIVESRK